MQNNHENSNINAGRADVLSINPANGAQSNLRIDVIREGDWWACLDNYDFVMPTPKIERYKVISDNMRAPHRLMILPGDSIRVEVIPVDEILPDKCYIVMDIYGNVILARIGEVIPGQSLKLQNLNPAYRDTFVKRNEVAGLGLIYQISRNVIPESEWDDLFGDEENVNEFGKSDK